MDFFNNEGKLIGTVEDGTYKTFRSPEHFMRMFQGFGISLDVLTKLKNNGIEKVKIIYDGIRGRKIYTATVDDFIASDKEYTDKGFDVQKFLSVHEMEERKV